MEAALAVPASKGADISTAADAATANTMVLMFVPLLPLPSQRETLQLVPGAKWFIAGAAHDPRGVTIQGCDVPHSEAPPGVRPSRCGRRDRRSAIGGQQRLK
jgi:hypothetical protein